MITIYTSPSCVACRKAKKWLKQHNLDYIEKNIFRNLLSVTEIKEMLSKTEKDATDIISKRSNSGLLIMKKMDSMSMNELIEFLQQNPSAIKRPVIIEGDKMQIGFNINEIRKFIAVRGA